MEKSTSLVLWLPNTSSQLSPSESSPKWKAWSSPNTSKPTTKPQMLLVARILETALVWVWMGQKKQVSGGIGSWESFAVALARFGRA